MTKLTNFGIITGNTLNTSFGFDEENGECEKLRKMLLNLFSQNKGVYYCDCQAGLGIYCAEEVLNSKNQLFCVAPYEAQSHKWSVDFRDRYYNLHEKSVDTKFISKKFFEGCIDECKSYITEVCDEIYVIATSKDEMPLCVKNALSSGKKVTIINCDDLTIKIKKQEDF